MGPLDANSNLLGLKYEYQILQKKNKKVACGCSFKFNFFFQNIGLPWWDLKTEILTN